MIHLAMVWLPKQARFHRLRLRAMPDEGTLRKISANYGERRQVKPYS